ncbi:hypothetical protein [Streptomyces sp. NPDC093109]
MTVRRVFAAIAVTLVLGGGVLLAAAPDAPTSVGASDRQTGTVKN